MSEEFESEYLPWQASTIERILDLQRQQRLPHALMLEIAGHQDAGPFIRYLCMTLVCARLDGLSLCRTCEACRLMQAGTYADFGWFTLMPDEKTKKISKNIKIEQIRNLIYDANLSARYDAPRIAVIYPADKMNRASANALLKTLEEPAPGVLLLLATHNPGRIPVTVRSRCQSVPVGLPTRSVASDWLAQRGLAEQDIPGYLEYADGDPVLALRLHEQGYTEIVRQFKSRLVEFLRDEIGVANLSRDLLGYDKDLIRRLVDMILRAYSLRMCGLDNDMQLTGDVDRIRAQALTQLQLQAQGRLQVEENNLDLQLQLEDVLISLKQILTRRRN